MGRGTLVSVFNLVVCVCVFACPVCTLPNRYVHTVVYEVLPYTVALIKHIIMAISTDYDTKEPQRSPPTK